MSSPEAELQPGGTTAGGLLALLDLAFGFFVWAAHFLVVYVTAAMACVIGLGAASTGLRAILVTALALVTLAAAAVNLLHAVRRYRRDGRVPDRQFRVGVSVGGDLIATVAIVWQLFPLVLVPACA